MIWGVATATADAVRRAHDWFEVDAGWAPPDDETLAEWVADGVCRCPDECLVAPDERREHRPGVVVPHASRPWPRATGRGRTDPSAGDGGGLHGSAWGPSAAGRAR